MDRIATRRLTTAGTIAVLVAGTAIGILATSEPDTIGVEGVVTLFSHSHVTNSGCTATTPYNDVTTGTPVRISKETRTVATGSLGAASYRAGEGCGWRFSIPDVPVEDGTYLVRVGAQSAVEVSGAALRSLVSFRLDEP